MILQNNSKKFNKIKYNRRMYEYSIYGYFYSIYNNVIIRGLYGYCKHHTYNFNLWVCSRYCSWLTFNKKRENIPLKFRTYDLCKIALANGQINYNHVPKKYRTEETKKLDDLYYSTLFKL